MTAYCCSGDSGTLVELQYEIDNLAADSASVTKVRKPTCNTNKYSESLACFKLTAEWKCGAGRTGPYGICNPIGSDASTVTKEGEKSASSSSSPSSSSSKMTLSNGCQQQRGGWDE